mgnify:CR=1 FL=1
MCSSDLGSSQFYVSLEDNLMRLFGSERIASMMDRLGLKEGEVIQHGMITRSIERAQRKVEENNFGIRKRLIEYDDVMNAQRDVVYTRRRNALFGDKLSIDLSNMMYELITQMVETYRDQNDPEAFEMECIKTFGTEQAVSDTEFKTLNETELISVVYTHVYAAFQERTRRMAEQVFPVLPFQKGAQVFNELKARGHDLTRADRWSKIGRAHV